MHQYISWSGAVFLVSGYILKKPNKHQKQETVIHIVSTVLWKFVDKSPISIKPCINYLMRMQKICHNLLIVFIIVVCDRLEYGLKINIRLMVPHLKWPFKIKN